MGEHHCHAHGCTVAVPPKLFMCKAHWHALSKPVRDAIWREYTPGQERTKRPSNRYMAVQRWAIATLAFKPNDETAAKDAAHYLIKAEMWRQRAIAAGQGDPLAALGVPRG